MQNYIRLSVVSIAEVLPLIIRSSKTVRRTIAGEKVKVSSLRLQTFVQSTTCSCCGLEATHFAIEKHREDYPYHLNLYGVKNGEEVLFTHDHTLARSLGGKNDMSNTTTMCSPCNFEKSKGERDLAEKLRNSNQENEPSKAVYSLDGKKLRWWERKRLRKAAKKLQKELNNAQIQID